MPYLHLFFMLFETPCMLSDYQQISRVSRSLEAGMIGENDVAISTTEVSYSYMGWYDGRDPFKGMHGHIKNSLISDFCP